MIIFRKHKVFSVYCPIAWRFLDAAVCLTLWGVVVSLAKSAWAGGL